VQVGIGAFVVAATAVSVGSVVQGAVGFGLNLLAAPFVALVIPEALPATLVLVAFPLAVSTVAREHHAVEWRALRWMLLGAVPGTLIGLAIVGQVDSSQLAVVVGTVTLTGVVLSVVSPPIREREWCSTASQGLCGCDGDACRRSLRSRPVDPRAAIASTAAGAGRRLLDRRPSAVDAWLLKGAEIIHIEREAFSAAHSR